MSKHKLAVFIALVCLVFSFIATLAFADGPNSSPVKVQISAYGSNEKSQRGLFTTDFIVPLYYPQDKNTLVFFNPKYTYTTPDADEINQGIGLRHIFNDSFILGINTFFDRRLAHSGKWYSQAGLGLEYLSHPLDVRLNWYKPLTRNKTIDTTYGFGSTSLIQYDNKEEPLQGLDFEAGVPVFDKYTKTRLYLGGFFYQSRLSKDVNGFRSRTETSLTNWLSLDTTFKSKTDGQTEFYGGARVILPFEWTKLFRKKSKQESSVPVASNSYLEDRIFDRVVRDIDIQSKSSTNQSKAHDLTYVDSSNNGTEDGSYAHPYKTIQNGVNNATGDKWVYVRKGNDYNELVTLTNSVTLWGAGYNGGFNGITATQNPVLDGTGLAAGSDNLTLGNNNTVMGLTIQTGQLHNIHVNDKTGDVIKYNTIQNATASGILLEDSSNVTIEHNTLSSNGDTGIDIEGTATGKNISNIVIQNNTISSNVVQGMVIETVAGSISNIVIQNNIIASNVTAGLFIGNFGTGVSVDIGGGSSGSRGYNSIYSNNVGADQIWNNVSGTTAKYNWWGTATPTNALVYDTTATAVSYTPYLTSDPN